MTHFRQRRSLMISTDYEEQQLQLQPLSLLMLSRGKAIGLAGEEARQIYGGRGDLWGRNTVMEECGRGGVGGMMERTEKAKEKE
ncbi:hypothetical protein PAMP_024178 [Pampus punctatissimus]